MKDDCYCDKMTGKAAAWFDTHTHTHVHNMLMYLLDGLQETVKYKLQSVINK